MDKLVGKVAVITGGAGGIGRATALLMAEEGAKIVIGDINQAGTEQTVKSITDNGGSAVAACSDISTMAGAETLIKAATENFGRIDILVNTAGFSKLPEGLIDTEKDWDSMIALNLKGPFNTMNFALPEMMKQETGGVVFNFISQAGFLDAEQPGWPTLGMAYSAAKAGILGLTSIASINYGKYGIRVNCIMPSAVTPGFPQTRPKVGGGMTGGPEAVAPVIAHLSTNEMNSVTNKYVYVCAGDVIVLDHPFGSPFLDGMHKVLIKDSYWAMDELAEKMPAEWVNKPIK